MWPSSQARAVGVERAVWGARHPSVGGDSTGQRPRWSRGRPGGTGAVGCPPQATPAKPRRLLGWEGFSLTFLLVSEGERGEVEETEAGGQRGLRGQMGSSC